MMKKNKPGVLLWLALFLLVAGCRPGILPDVTSTTPPPADTPTLDESTQGETSPTLEIPPANFNTPIPVPTQGPYLPALPIWGVEMYYLGEDAGLNLAKDAGVFWLRRNALLWSAVEPQEGQRDWAAITGLEVELKTAAMNGFQTILVVRSTPEWAQSVSGSLCSAPRAEKLESFANFMYDIVRKYSLPPYNVQYWEIGNEPDVAPELVPSEAPFGCWGETGDPYYGGRAYADILKAIYPKIKQANPQAQVLVGGLLMNCDPVNPPETEPGSGQFKDCVPSRYLEGILVNGGGNYFDGVSFHAYDYYFGNKLGRYSNANWNSAWNANGPVLVAKANYLRGVLNLYGFPDKFLLNSELALLCGRDGNEPECQNENFRLTKAYYLAQAYVTAIAEHLTANIWYSLTGWRGSGLVDAQKQPNEAYQALKISSQRLAGAGYLGPITDFNGVRGFAFERGESLIWVLWSLDGEKHTLELEQLPKAIYDVFGVELNASQRIEVKVAPMYVEFSE